MNKKNLIKTLCYKKTAANNWIHVILIATLSFWVNSSIAGINHGNCRIAVPGHGADSSYEYEASVNATDNYSGETQEIDHSQECIIDNNITPSTLICTNKTFNDAFKVDAWTCQYNSTDPGKWIITKTPHATQYACERSQGKSYLPLINDPTLNKDENNYDQTCTQILGSHNVDLFLKQNHPGDTVPTSEKHTCILLKEDKTLVCKYPLDNFGGVRMTGNLCQETKWTLDSASKAYVCSN